MMRRLGHTECGIYAEVTANGSIAVGDTVGPEQPELL
jgi:MOSC domain-containing protein YiiM